MRRSNFSQKSFFFLSLFLALWGWTALKPTSNTYACTWTGPAKYTVTERTDDAEFVFEGTVLKISIPYDGTPIDESFKGEDPIATPQIGSYYATVVVQQYIKGTGPEVVEIDNFGFGGSCLSSAFPGSNFIFFADGDSPDRLIANYLGAYSAVEKATEANIAEAIKASGQQLTQTNLSSKHVFAVIFYRFWPFFVCLAPLIFVGLIWFMWKKGKQKNPPVTS